MRHASCSGRFIERRLRALANVGVDADDDIDHLTQIRQAVHAFVSFFGRDVVPVRDEGSAGL